MLPLDTLLETNSICITMAHDARAIVNFLLDYAESRSTPLTIMALLKVLYFAHGWHLAKFGEPLVKNEFEAWQHGPVVRVVYDCFKGRGADPVVGRATQLDPVSRERNVVPYVLSESQRSFLIDIFDIYGHINPLSLSDMTHEAGSPWDRVWNAPPGKVSLGMKIPNESIRQHFLMPRPSRRLH